MRTKLILTATSAFITTILIICIFIFLSLWHLWYLLPDQGTSIAINQAKPGTPLAIEYLTNIYPDLKPALDASRRIAININHEQTTLIIVPRNFIGSKVLTSRFQNQGWSAQNYGLIIIANKGVDYSPVILPSITKTIRNIINSDTPLQPAMIFHLPAGSITNIEENIYGLAIAKAKPLSGEQEISLQINSISPKYDAQTAPKYTKVSGLQLALPSRVLATLPVESQVKLQDKILLHLPYVKTKPDIISLLAKQKWVQINIKNEDISISMKGNIISAADQFITWSKQEEAYTRPQKRPFQLPDNTLAYEEGPGEIKNIFQAVGNNCRGASWPALDTSKAGVISNSEKDRVGIWICREGDTLTVSNSHEQAKLSLTTASTTSIDSWNIAIGVPWIAAVSSNIKALYGQSNQNIHTFTAILK